MICIILGVDVCAYNPCEHGQCKEKEGGYECVCLPGYHGEYCDCGQLIIGRYKGQGYSHFIALTERK